MEIPELNNYFVFEFYNNKFKQISVGLKDLEAANSFIETMKDGMYYKSINPEIQLIALEVKSIY